MDHRTRFSRPQWMTLLQTALAAGETAFVRQAAQAYLAHHPHDLAVRRMLGQALLQQGDAQAALQHLEALCVADPEDLAGQRLRLEALRRLGRTAAAAHAAACVLALSPKPPSGLGLTPAPWGALLRQAIHHLRQDPAQAEPLVLQALPADPPTPLPAVVHLHWAYRTQQWPGLLTLARTYHARWPQTLAVRYYLAYALNLAGHEAEAVAQLHALVGLDPAAQVLRRTFGDRTPYLDLWPREIHAPLDLPIPAAVAGHLGWNLLPGVVTPPQEDAPPPSPPEPAAEPPAAAPPASTTFPPAADAAPPDAPPPPEAVAEPPPPPADPVLRDIARRLHRPDLAATEGRFPVYVVLTSLRGLQSQYGPETARVILDLAQKLVAAVAQRPDWEARLLLSDDPRTCAALGVKPAPAKDPWAIKRQLADLDAQLARKGAMIGALFILGGPEVIPFHHLPNPVRDDDATVPSDNPYGARDENFYAPEWPVGRLPGGAGDDPAVLLAYLRRAIAYHRRLLHNPPWYRRFWLWLRRPFLRRQQSHGYAAAAWTTAARTVFRAIGPAKRLATSPPHHAENLPRWNGSHLAYFNLHGLVDSPRWYGQRLDLNGVRAEDYPVALRPEDIPQRFKPPRVAFSEACYGAHLDGRRPHESVALRLLETGTLGFVGSTVTAYGAVRAPLAAADLLAWHFWHEFKRGFPLGEALRRAKFAFAQDMMRRHGVLDGEDLKTLLSFVLYGDPLLQEKHLLRLPKAIGRPYRPLQVKAVADQPLEAAPMDAALSPEAVQKVRAAVAKYLPGMKDAETFVASEGPVVLSPGGESQAPMPKGHAASPRRVVMLRKKVTLGEVEHVHYVRVLLNRRGRIAKFSLSR